MVESTLDRQRTAKLMAPMAIEDNAARSPECHSPFGVFEECPHCGGRMAPEHAHYRCEACGWRDSCCD